MKTNLKKQASVAVLIVSVFFIMPAAKASSSVPDTGKMSKMSSSKMNSKMSKKKKMDKMSDSKMKPATDGGKM